MPNIGTIAKGRQIGFKGGDRYRWSDCESCGKERWVALRQYRQDKSRVCRPCSNLVPKHITKQLKVRNGYIVIWTRRNDFFRQMAWRSGYVLEHRLVMAQSLGRCLHRWEIVHHKNGIRIDNRIENLQLVSDDRHKQLTILEMRITVLEKRATVLEVENVLLRTSLKEALRDNSKLEQQES